MGWLDDFEQRIDHLVNGAFAKTFKGEVQPVEIAAALRREMDARRAIVSVGRTVVPNAFVAELSPADQERLSVHGPVLCNELEREVKTYAEDQRYAFNGAVSVTFEANPQLGIGEFRVRSSTQAAPAGPGPNPPQSPRPGEPRLTGPTSDFPLTRAVNLIGRAADATVRVDDPGVSRHHAEIILGATTVIRDLGSTNGTFVDDVRVGVNETRELREGSRVMVGSTILVYRTG